MIGGSVAGTLLLQKMKFLAHFELWQIHGLGTGKNHLKEKNR
jgi:hypothetical protein